VSFREFRRQADAVRSIPLPTVLAYWGAERDRRDRSQWRTRRGPLSVTGAQFFNWHRREGGGGAIDLVMHLSGWDARTAIQWLGQHLGSGRAAGSSLPRSSLNASLPAPSPSSPVTSCRLDTAAKGHQPFRLPVASRTKLQRVRRYLTEQRGLAEHILEPLLTAGKIYADRRGNAVFLMMAGKPNRAIGAELRGTGKQIWRGLAPGTRKDAGYFWIGPVSSEKAGDPRKIVLCESAIDAISCFQLHSTYTCISTAGVRPDAPWLHPLLARGYEIYCGFDDDEPGNAVSRQMITRHPSIQRLRPPAHDWNDALTGRP
jgi:hypothetical protein